MNFIFVALAIALVFIIRYLVAHRAAGNSSPSSNLPSKLRVAAEYMVPDTPVSFGYKCKWLAVYTRDTKKLADRVGLKDAQSCNWKAGIEYAYEDRVFISPPVDGWSFIISLRHLPDAQDQQSVDLIKTMLQDLSREFGRAQYFGTYRVVSYDCWMKAENGQIERAYGFVDGGNTVVEGDPTDAERKYKLVNTFSSESAEDPNYFDREDLVYPDESMTMEIAGAWSINPQDLEGRTDIGPGLGLVGMLA